MQGKPIIALWPAFPQACFHPHSSMGGQMEIWIRSGRPCQLYLLRERLLRESHPFYLFPAPWNLWNELRGFSETFRSLHLWIELGLPASYKAVALAANPRHKAQLILETWWWFSDMEASSCEHLVWLHYRFMLVRQHKAFWGKASVLCCWISWKPQFSVLKQLNFEAKSGWMLLKRKADPLLVVWTIKLYLKEWGKSLKSLV